MISEEFDTIMWFQFCHYSPNFNVKDEKRPWILRAREESIRIPSRTPQEEDRSLPQTLIYISCGWESFKEVFLVLLSKWFAKSCI